MSLSIHEFLFGESRKYRAVLWKGYKANDSGREGDPVDGKVVFVSTFSHVNFFELLRLLRASVEDWSHRKGGCCIAGIDDNSRCWPIDSSNKLQGSSLEQIDLSVGTIFTHCGGVKGLELIVYKTEDGCGHRIQLTDYPYAIIHKDKPTRVFSVACCAENLFQAATNLIAAVQSVARNHGLVCVEGVDNKGSIWPEGLCEFRFA